MQLKNYQQATLDLLRSYIEALQQQRATAAHIASMNVVIDYEWDREAWETVRGKRPYVSRRAATGERVPAVCLKIPTGGGKTLLAVHALDLINRLYLRQQAGLVLWIVPTSAIYRQTLDALRDRTHPYRRLLDIASAGKTLILEKDAAFTPADVGEQLTVLLLMLPSANRQNRETLRLFRDQGGFDAFFPREDQWQQHGALLETTPNLDTFEAQTWSGQRVVKTSLGNTLRLLRPVIVLDEGHKAYSATAQQTLFGFNPSFVLELSATPPSESNQLVSISGRELLREGMIKLDLHLYIKASADWRDTLLASHTQRVALEQHATRYSQNGGDYIRPICLIQVERTGEKQRRPPFIHAEEAREFLIAKCAVPPEQIAVKSSERDEIEQINLLAEDCPIRYIITRSALQEGWDCPFAYVLTVLTNSEASDSVTQLVGRVLRQPYARKTGNPALDECYVYCFRDRSGKTLRSVQSGLSQEGLGDVVGRVVAEGEGSGVSKVDVHIRPEYNHYGGKVYLPCFVVADGRGGFREVRYEIDILSRVDWEQASLAPFDTLELNPEQRQDSRIDIGVGTSLTALHATAAVDTPIDLVLMTRQLTGIVPSPWMAYDLVREAIDRLQKRYSEERIRRDLGFVIEELKKRLVVERDRLAEAAFLGMVEHDELRFCLLSGNASSAVPERISVRADARRLNNEVGAPLQRQLFDYVPEDEFNEYERSVALYLDRQAQILAWYRNIARLGYSIQGWQRDRVYPDLIAFGKHADIQTVYVLETKGLHLKNDDTRYKQELFTLCAEQSKPTPWNCITDEFSDHAVEFKVIFDDEWERVLNALLQV